MHSLISDSTSMHPQPLKMFILYLVIKFMGRRKITPSIHNLHFYEMIQSQTKEKETFSDSLNN